MYGRLFSVLAAFFSVRVLNCFAAGSPSGAVCDAAGQESCALEAAVGGIVEVTLSKGAPWGFQPSSWPPPIFVDSVAPGSPAERLGLSRNDILTAVNGVRVGDMRKSEFLGSMQRRPLQATFSVAGADDAAVFNEAMQRFEEREPCFIGAGNDVPWSPRRMTLRAAHSLCRRVADCRGITVRDAGGLDLDREYDVFFKRAYDCHPGDDWYSLAAHEAEERAWHYVETTPPWDPPELGSFSTIPNFEVLSEEPLLVQFDDFLSDAEIDHIIQVGSPLLARSTTTMKRTTDKTRTSSTAWLSEPAHWSDPVLRGIDERIAVLTGLPRKNMEHMQVLRYNVGEHYIGHSDYMAEHTKWPCGVRYGTFFMYLSDVEAGGHTSFPKLGLEVRPKKGRAVLWWTINATHWRQVRAENQTKTIPREDHRLFHTALPVEDGVKWAVNRWLHGQDFVNNHRLGLLKE